MKKLALYITVGFLSFAASAQDIGKFLEGGVEDGNKLMEGYLQPAFEGFGYALNSGWYNTGKPHKLLGFDITVTGNLAYIPEESKFFTVNPADYKNLSTQPSESGKTDFPTLMGPNLDADDIPYLVFNEGTEDEVRVSGPSGLGLEAEYGTNFVPAPAVQLGIGLPKNTELKLRLVPEQTFGDPGEQFTTSTFGIGIMHDVKQWIPGIKNLPFDLSGFFAFSKMKNSMELDVDKPENLGSFDVSGTTIQGIISKKLSVLTVYAGLGMTSSKVTFNVTGDYEVGDETFTDPINLEYSSASPRANIGARLKLLIFTFHAEYALQKYNTFTGGIGISIR